MTDNSARFRRAALVLGVSFILLLLLPVADDAHPITLIGGVALGTLFIAYGIGGPSLLKKIGLARFVTKGTRKASASEIKNKTRTYVLMIGLSPFIALIFMQSVPDFMESLPDPLVVIFVVLWQILLLAGLIMLAQSHSEHSQAGATANETSSLPGGATTMPKNRSLTGGQLFLLLILSFATPDWPNATWAPFLPVEHFSVCFIATLLVHCLRRFFIMPPRRQAITWFDWVVFLTFLSRSYDLYVDYSGITYGELLWRATTLLSLLIAHIWVNKIALFPSPQRVAPKPSSSARRPTALVFGLGFLFRKTTSSSADPAHAVHPESMDNKVVTQRSSRFWVILCILLCIHFYRYIALTKELDPVAALEQAGASTTATGTFGSVDSIESGSDLTDADLIHLQRVTFLKELELSGSNITDAGLVHLEGLAGLKVLRLHLTQVTDDGVAKLKKALPDCKIIVERAYTKAQTF